MTDFTDSGARLHVAVLADADRLTVTLTGELDGISGPPLVDVLNTAVLNDRVEHLDVDMAQVGFLDLPGLRALLCAHQVCAARHVTLRLHDPQPHVAWLLQFTDSAAVLLAGGTAAHPPAGGQPRTDGDDGLEAEPADPRDERDQRAHERDEQADDRERLMQARDRLLDERQQRVSDHQRWEDIREDLADVRERNLDRREHEN